MPGSEIVVTLPTLHADQVRAWRAMRGASRVLLRAGRRWGKTALLTTLICDCAIKGGKVGFFAPEARYAREPFFAAKEILSPLIKTSSKVEGEIRLAYGGGKIDMWSLKDNELAGRGRSYDLVVFDEHAFNKPDVKDTWEKAVRPTLFDRDGKAIFASNTRGIDEENHFYKLHMAIEEGNAPGWVEIHSPTSANPLLPMRREGESKHDHDVRRAAAIEELRRENAPNVFLQEFMADFISWDGAAFFDLQKMLVDGLPVEPPAHCDYVFAVVDTATKTGRENDATAVTYWARTFAQFGPHQLVLLDWDIQQIEGALLETWLPTVFKNLEHHAAACRARGGSMGAWIEDKSSGMVLLQQAQRRGWPARAIDSKLTALGKVERAINASPYVYQGLVKISGPAHDKVVTYKGATRNHLEGQVLAFRVDDKDPTKADDLLDCFTYSCAIALGNNQGC